MIKDEITSKNIEDFKTGMVLLGRDLAVGMAKIADAFAKGVEQLREAQQRK